MPLQVLHVTGSYKTGGKSARSFNGVYSCRAECSVSTGRSCQLRHRSSATHGCDWHDCPGCLYPAACKHVPGQAHAVPVLDVLVVERVLRWRWRRLLLGRPRCHLRLALVLVLVLRLHCSRRESVPVCHLDWPPSLVAAVLWSIELVLGRGLKHARPAVCTKAEERRAGHRLAVQSCLLRKRRRESRVSTRGSVLKHNWRSRFPRLALRPHHRPAHHVQTDIGIAEQSFTNAHDVQTRQQRVLQRSARAGRGAP